MSSLRRTAVLWVLLLLVLPACRAGSTSSPSAPPDLQAQLLSVRDLPVGWGTDLSAPLSQDNEPACLYQAQTNLRSTTAAQARFVGGIYVPIFSESLSYFGATSAASAALTRASNALTTCGPVAFRSGTTFYVGAIGPALAAGLGSDARAWRLSLRGSDGSVIGAYLVLARHDAIVLLAIVADARQPVRPALLALPVTAYFKIT
jgi:hypothetical protein